MEETSPSATHTTLSITITVDGTPYYRYESRWLLSGVEGLATRDHGYLSSCEDDLSEGGSDVRV